MAQAVNQSLRLQQPYPIALSDITSNYAFRCIRDDGGYCFHSFHACYAAKHFLDLIIDDRDYKWIGRDKIMLTNGTTIQSEFPHQLEEVMEYEFTPREREWEITEPNLTYYRQFIGKARMQHIEKAPEKPEKVTRSPDETTRGAILAKPRREVPQVEKVTRARAKVKAGDYITISQICQQLGYEPSRCRAMLRALKIEKPAHGWSWNATDAAAIKSKLGKRLK